ALAAFAWLTRDSREQILHLQRLGRTISSSARFLHSRDAPYACPTPFSHLVFPTSLSASWPVCPRPFESLRTDYGLLETQVANPHTGKLMASCRCPTRLRLRESTPWATNWRKCRRPSSTWITCGYCSGLSIIPSGDSRVC